MFARSSARPHKAGQIFRDECTGAVTALDITLGQQVLIRQNHGRTRHAELRCHGTGGWYPRAWTKRTRQHSGAYLHIDLPCERRAARPIELPSVEVGPSAQCHWKNRLQVVCCNEQKWTILPIQ